jgi:hypothetical protein
LRGCAIGDADADGRLRGHLADGFLQRQHLLIANRVTRAETPQARRWDLDSNNCRPRPAPLESVSR